MAKQVIQSQGERKIYPSVTLKENIRNPGNRRSTQGYILAYSRLFRAYLKEAARNVEFLAVDKHARLYSDLLQA